MAPSRQFSNQQLELMVQFMEDHRDFAVHKFCSTNLIEKRRYAGLWIKLVTMLNSVPTGAKKPVAKWQAFWNDKKYKVRKKASDFKTGAAGTVPLTPMEQRILAIIGKVAVVNGNEKVRIPFQEETVETVQIEIKCESLPPESDEPLPQPSRNKVPSATDTSWASTSAAPTDPLSFQSPALLTPCYWGDEDSDSSSEPVCADTATAPAASASHTAYAVPAACNTPTPSWHTPATSSEHAAAAAAATSIPVTCTPDMAPPPSPAPRLNGYLRKMGEVPKWAIEMEERRMATEAQMVEGIAQTNRLLTQILNLMQSTLNKQAN